MQRLLASAIILATAVTAFDQSDAKVASGLKEALSVGASKAVQLTGVKDGFYGNRAIKILMPEKLRTLEKGLRMMGQGKQIDEFELSMNRAAESAAPAAEPIFKKAIRNMGFSDAKGILTGGHTAATDYFKRTTSENCHRIPSHRGTGNAKDRCDAALWRIDKADSKYPVWRQSANFRYQQLRGRQDFGWLVPNARP